MTIDFQMIPEWLNLGNHFLLLHKDDKERQEITKQFLSFYILNGGLLIYFSDTNNLETELSHLDEELKPAATRQFSSNAVQFDPHDPIEKLRGDVIDFITAADKFNSFNKNELAVFVYINVNQPQISQKLHLLSDVLFSKYPNYLIKQLCTISVRSLDHNQISEQIGMHKIILSDQTILTNYPSQMQIPLNLILSQSDSEKGIGVKLNNSIKSIHDFMNFLGDIVFIHQFNGQLLDVNDAACMHLGYSYEELIQSSTKIFTSDKKFYTEQVNRLKKTGQVLFETKLLAKNMSQISVEVNARLINHNQTQAILSISRDITQRKEAEEKLQNALQHQETLIHIRTKNLREINNQLETEINEHRRLEKAIAASENRYRQLAESIKDIFLALDHNLVITYWNLAAESETGIKSVDALGKQLRDIFPAFYENNIKNTFQYVKTKNKPASIVNRSEIDGETTYHEINIYPLEEGYSLFAKDVTMREIAEEKLRFLSTHDALTGIYNRTYFENEIVRIQNSRLFPVSIFTADLDGLKFINDEFGHSAGDEILKKTATLLKECFRREDVVARIGGDEFVALMPDTDTMSAQHALTRVSENIEKYNATNPAYRLNLSCGMATGKSGENLNEILKMADLKMYQEKKAKRKKPIK